MHAILNNVSPTQMWFGHLLNDAWDIFGGIKQNNKSRAITLDYVKCEPNKYSKTSHLLFIKSKKFDKKCQKRRCHYFLIEGARAFPSFFHGQSIHSCSA